MAFEQPEDLDRPGRRMMIAPFSETREYPRCGFECEMCAIRMIRRDEACRGEC